MSHRAYIGLGSNLGDRLGHLQEAVRRLHALPETEVLRCSGVYRSEGHTLEPAPVPEFLNAVVEVRTSLSPEVLLDRCLAIEREMGRERRQRWAPRTLDLDILLYDDRCMDGGRLTLPHPRLGERRFVLLPLADLNPDLEVPPPFNATVRTLLERCTDTHAIEQTGYSLCP